MIGVKKKGNIDEEHGIIDFKQLKKSFQTKREKKRLRKIIEKTGGGSSLKRCDNGNADHTIEKELKRVKESQSSSQKEQEEKKDPVEKKKTKNSSLFNFFKKN